MGKGIKMGGGGLKIRNIQLTDKLYPLRDENIAKNTFVAVDAVSNSISDSTINLTEATEYTGFVSNAPCCVCEIADDAFAIGYLSNNTAYICIGKVLDWNEPSYITYGTAVSVGSTYSDFDMCKIDNNKFLVVLSPYGSPRYQYFYICSVDGTDISVVSSYTQNTLTYGGTPRMCAMDNGLVFLKEARSDGYYYHIISTIGDDITILVSNMLFDSSSKAINSYPAYINGTIYSVGYDTLHIGSVIGTDISWETPVSIMSSDGEASLDVDVLGNAYVYSAYGYYYYGYIYKYDKATKHLRSVFSGSGNMYENYNFTRGIKWVLDSYIFALSRDSGSSPKYSRIRCYDATIASTSAAKASSSEFYTYTSGELCYMLRLKDYIYALCFYWRGGSYSIAYGKTVCIHAKNGVVTSGGQYIGVTKDKITASTPGQVQIYGG